MRSYKNEDYRNRKKREQEERARIREFDKELFSYTGQVPWVLPGIFSFVLIVLMAVPVQEIVHDATVIWLNVFTIAIWGTFYVLLPYVNVTDFLTPKKKTSATYSKLKYLPVSKKQYRRVRMEYLFRYLWKQALIGLVVQCAVAAAVLRSVTVWNVLYVVGFLLVFPLLLGRLVLS